MWGFLGGKFGGDKWGFLIDRVEIFSQDLLATLRTNNGDHRDQESRY